MSKKEHAFNENELIGSMQEALAHAKGKRTLRTTTLPKAPKKMTPADIALLRRKMKASTPVFAAYLNVSADAVRGWENNRRTPSGATLRLLEIVSKRPELLVS